MTLWRLCAGHVTLLWCLCEGHVTCCSHVYDGPKVTVAYFDYISVMLHRLTSAEGGAQMHERTTSP